MEQKDTHERIHKQNILNAEQFQYHQRITTYDPNMCSTAARLSPPYQQQGEQIILSHTHHQEICDSLSKSARSEELQPGYTTDYHQHHTNNYQNLDYPNNAEQIIFHKTPNGNIFQDYCNSQINTNNSEIIQYVQPQTTQINGNTEIYGQQYFETNTSVNTDCEQEVQANVYQFVPTNNEYHPVVTEEYLEKEVIISLNEKNRQRTLLESTMSPLLAAVDDITQRELEAAEFLYQNFENNLYNRLSYYPEEEHASRTSGCNNTKNNRKKKSTTEDITEIGSGDDGEMIEYLVVSDHPVQTRAKASLPIKYLSFSKLNKEPTICAKREIPKMTKFGPIEGDLRFVSDVMLDMLRLQLPRFHPLFLIGKTRMLDTSNENTSNWMRYVKLAQNFNEQNLLLYEENDKLFFKCLRKIQPKEELYVGYSNQYANKYNLEILESNSTLQVSASTMSWHNNVYSDGDEDISNNETKNYKNDNKILANINNNSPNIQSCKKKRLQRKKKKNNVLDMYRKNSSRCYVCNKAFMTNFSLRKHLKTHADEKKTQKLNKKEKKLKGNRNSYNEKLHNCNQCQRNFLTAVALKLHQNIHQKDRYFSCILCPKKYKKIMEFRKHIKTHSSNDLYYCNICKKKYLEYRLVRKHIKLYHKSLTKYRCDECGREFLDNNFLKRHQLIHSDEYNFNCNECHKKFKRKDKLKEHMDKVHSIENELKKLHREEKKNADKLKKLEIRKIKKNQINDGTQYLKISPKKKNNKKVVMENSVPKIQSKIDLESYIYKCTECSLGFKRRGMLVNHINKFHPDQSIKNVKELNEPLIKSKLSFFCLFCPKIYASNYKRKLHILKYHPDQDLPVNNNTGVQKIGNITATVQQCSMCYRQYSSKAKLLAHHRKNHQTPQKRETVVNEEIEKKNQNQVIIEQQHPNDLFFHPQELLENKLLQLSSAALDFL